MQVKGPKGFLMSILRIALGLFLGVIATFGAGAAALLSYPSKPIRIVTTGVGSSTDFASRLVAQGISGPLGQSLIVDNRGINAIELVDQAPPDGYTLLAVGGQLWIGPLLRKVSYDPIKDFLPVALLVSSPNLLTVHPSMGTKSVKEFIALAKANPGAINYASGATGSSNHLAAELFKAMAGVDLARVAYRGAGPAVNAVIAGEVKVMFPSAASAASHVKAGRLTALAVTSAQPSALFPGLPTVSASGVPDYEAVAIEGIFVPALTSATVITRLNLEIARFLRQSQVQERFLNAGVEAEIKSPAEFLMKIKSEMARLGEVIKTANIRAD
jgi:tripartite-type tricarboxylate transporter receptor subunit TctC